MKRFTISLFTLAWAAVLLVCGTVSTASAKSPEATTLVVKLVAGLSAVEQAAVIVRDGGVEKSSILPLRLHVISVPTIDLPVVRQNYKSDKQVERVEVDKARKAEGAIYPTDTSYGVQWALTKIAYESVFGAVTPAGTAKIAILDTGVDTTHPDLAANIIPGTSILDSTSNGLTDPNGHGTAMAGIVAAVTDNGNGIAGVAYQGVSIMPVTVLDASATGQDSDIISGIVWAADHGANVILMAFSNPDFSLNLQDAIDYAWSKGAVLVSAAGNGSVGTPTFPAGDQSVIGVSATDQNDALASFSNYGQGVFLAAPGTNIYTTGLNGSYSYLDGTSASSAVVAGVAAFMKAVDPTLSNGVIAGRLAKSADAIGPAGDPNNQTYFGNGRVNMANALASTSTDFIQPSGAAPVGTGGPYVGPYTAAGTSSTSMATSLSTSSYGQPVTFTATITGTNSPSGTINFYHDGTGCPGTTLLNPTPLAVTTVNATTATGAYTIANLGAQSTPGHKIYGCYNGDANNAASGNYIRQLVAQDTPVTTVASSPNPSTYGASVTFTATVANSYGSNGEDAPTGTVNFDDEGTIIGTAIPLVSGAATFSYSSLALATPTGHTIKAIYNGDTNYATGGTATGTLSGGQVVNKANTTTTVISSANPAVKGQSITFTATVTKSGAGATPTGNVIFDDEGTVIGTVALNGSGVATLTYSGLALATPTGHTITAYYQGDTNYNISNGVVAGGQVVNKANTTTTVTSSANPAVKGQSVTFTATVAAAAPGSGTPTGNVIFDDEGTVIGTVAVNGSGVATLTYSGLALATPTGHTITAYYQGDTNYNISNGVVAGGQVVNKANTTTTVTSSANPAVYGQSVTFTATVAAAAPGSGVPTGNVVFDDEGTVIGTVALNSSGVATLAYSGLAVATPTGHTITAYYQADTNYNASNGVVAGGQVVNKAALTVTANNASKTYGAANPALTVSYAGFVNGDTAASLTTQPTASTTATAASPAGSYAITPAGGASSKYTFTYVNGTLTVNKATLTVTANNASKSYGAANPALTVSYAGFVNGDTAASLTTQPTASTTATASSPAGSYAITPAGGASSNYSFSYVNGSLTVNQAVLTITAAAKNKTYGAADPALTYSASGFVNGDTGSVITGSLTRAAGESVGTYAISQGSLSAGTNYSIAYTGAGLTINKAALTVTAAAKSKTYGAADPSQTYTVTGLVNGDTGSIFTGSLSRAAGENTGAYAITLGSLSAGTNYTVAYTGASLTINKATLSITADAVSKAYGAADPTLTYAAAGFANGDTGSIITGGLSRAAGVSVGSYAISQGSLLAGTNYTVAYTGASLTINPAVLTISAAAASKTYGSADPPLTYSTSGFVNGDTSSILTGSISRTAGEGAGTYAINQGSLSVGSNYSIAYTSATLTINPAPLTITAAGKSKTYGAADPALTHSATGFVNGDTMSILTGSLVRAAGENAAIYAISQGTVSAGTNYTVTYIGANLTINKAPLTIAAAAASKTYGAVDPALIYSATGLVNGDTVSSITGSLSRTAGENGGSYAISLGALSAGPNYTVAYTGSSLTVTKAVLTITAAAASKTFGTVDPALTYSASGFANGDTGSILTGTLSRAAGESVGSYPINQGSLSAGSNYTISFTGLSPILTITQAPATVTLEGLNPSYDGTAKSATAATVPAGLSVTFTYNGLATAPAAQGSYTVVGTVSDTNYQGSATGILTISKGVPVITWANPAGITYGTALSATQLNATASVPGAFFYSPGAGTVFATGNSQTLSLIFTPTDTTNYSTVTKSVTLPALTLVAPATITAPATSTTASFTVSWSATNASGATYALEQSVDGVTYSSVYSGKNTIATVTGLTNGTYSYRVKASLTGYIDSAYTTSGSTVVTLTLGAPATINVPASSSTGNFTASWGVTNASGATYVLEQSVDGGVTFTPVYSGASNSASITGLANGSYIYRVKAANKSGYIDSGYTTSASFTVALSCAAPATVIVPTSSTTGSFSVSWGATNVSGATYALEQSSDGVTYTAAYSGTGTTASLTALAKGAYTFRVKATKAGYADSAYASSASVAVTYTLVAPATITVPTSSTTGSFTASWGATNVSGATYVLEQSSDGGATYTAVMLSGMNPGSSTLTSITGLANGNYLYRVKATKTGFTDSAYTTSGNVTVTLILGAPATVTVPASSTTGSFTASWSATNQSGATYVLEQSSDGVNFSSVYSGTIASTKITGLAKGSYTFRVKATNVTGYADSAYTTSGSMAVTYTLAAPAAINVPTGSATGNISVSWGATNVSGASYVLEQSSDGVNYTPVMMSAGMGNSAGITGLANGTYSYRVKASLTGYTDSAYTTSGSFPVALTLGAPALIIVPATSPTGTFPISWGATNVSGASYVLEQSSDGVSYASVYNGTNTTTSITGLAKGSYTFRVKATNKAGYADSGYTTSGSVAVTYALGAPATFNVPTSSTTGSFLAIWGASNVSGASYILEQSSDGGATYSAIYNGTSASANITGLTNGTYGYRVKATLSGFADSAYTTSGNLAVTLTLGAPATLSVPTSSTTGAFTASWSASNVSGATYVLEQSADGGATYSTAYSGANTSASITGLAKGTYTFRVKATNKTGYLDSAYTTSGSVAVTYTLAAPATISVPTGSTTGGFLAIWGVSNVSGVTYVLEQTSDGVSYASIYSGTSTSKNITGLANGTYGYRVKATLAGYTDSDYTTSTSLTVALTLGTPTTINLPPSSTTGSFAASWGATNVSGATYVLEQSVDGGVTHSTAYSGTGTSTSITALAKGTYTFRVKATKAGYADSAYLTSGSVAVTYTLAAPSTINVPTSSTTGSFMASWGSTNLSGATYSLEQSSDGVTYSSVYSGTGTSKSITGLANGTYSYRVKAALSPYTDSDYMTSGSFTVTLTLAPPATLNVPTSSTTGSFTASWGSTNVSGANYALEVSNDGGLTYSTAYSGTGTSTSITSLAKGTYTYRVKATKAGYVDSAYLTSGNVAVTYILDAPATLNVPASSTTGSFTATWGATNVGGASYVLEVSSDGVSYNPTYSGKNTFANLTVPANGTYTYRVKATLSGYADSATTNSGSMAVTFTCAAPATIIVPASSTTGSFTVSWGATSVAGATYFLEVSSDGGLTYASAYSGTSTSATITALAKGTYTYRVKATKTGYLDSGYTTSGNVAVTYILAAPATISVPATSTTGTFNATWGATNVSGATYILEVSSDGGATYTSVMLTGMIPGASTSTSITGLTNGTYLYRVKATKTGYTDSAYTTSGTLTVTLILGAPATITVPASSTTGSFTATWGATNVSGATYVLEQSSDGVTYTPVYSGTSTSAKLTALALGNYTFRVKATNLTGYADSSYTTSGSVAVTYTLVAPATINVPASNTSGIFAVSWGPTNVSGATYVLEVSSDGGATYAPVMLSGMNAGSTSTSITGLANGTYSYRVKATLAPYTDSAYTTSGSFTVTLTLGAPSLIIVTNNNTTGSFPVSWAATKVSGATYVLEQSSDGGLTYTTAYSGTNTTTSITGLLKGTYIYRVKATGVAGYLDSAYTTSGNVVVTLTLGAPDTITVPTSSTTGSVGISWSLSNVGGVTYVLEQSSDGGTTYIPVFTGTSAKMNNGVATTISGLGTGTYLYRVKATSPGYNDSAYTTSGNLVVTLTLADPATITVPANSTTGGFTVSWDATNVSGATYVLEQSIDGGLNFTQVYSGTDSFSDFTGLANWTYLYRVKATMPGYVDSGWATSGYVLVLQP